jgi:phage tail sheath protein FI
MVEEERGDTLYIVTTPDKPFGYGDTESEMFSPQDAVWNLEDSEIDTNYAATYYPWVKYYDNENSVYIYLPPTRDAVRNFAYTDNTAYPWFAAAGWNRGSVNGVRPKKTLKLAEQDVLYNGRINFVNTFAGEGMKLWGDKNLQKYESQMNRISKRRLLLRLRKQLENACVGLLFDPNDATAKQSFISAVTPVLDSVKSSRGITDYRVQVDDSAEARERLELPAVIFIKPTPTLEYITINFVITPQGVSFDDI